MTLPTDISTKPKASNLKKLASSYNVSAKTLKKWIMPFNDYIGMVSGARIFTPEQVRRIYEKIGEP